MAAARKEAAARAPVADANGRRLAATASTQGQAAPDPDADRRDAPRATAELAARGAAAPGACAQASAVAAVAGIAVATAARDASAAEVMTLRGGRGPTAAAATRSWEGPAARRTEGAVLPYPSRARHRSGGATRRASRGLRPRPVVVARAKMEPGAVPPAVRGGKRVERGEIPDAAQPTAAARRTLGPDDVARPAARWRMRGARAALVVEATTTLARPAEEARCGFQSGSRRARGRERESSPLETQKARAAGLRRERLETATLTPAAEMVAAQAGAAPHLSEREWLPRRSVPEISRSLRPCCGHRRPARPTRWRRRCWGGVPAGRPASRT